MDRKTLLKKLKLSSFIAFDFETTGLDPKKDRIIEIAAIRFEHGKPVDRFVTLLNPQQPIVPLITDITGISNEMVEKAPLEEDIAEDFQEFLGNEPLVAHNIAFDWSFLKAFRERHEFEPVEHDQYDSLGLARAFLFDQPAFNLGSIAEHYGLSAKGSHRAETDTENCGQVFLNLLEEAASYPLRIVSRILEIIKPYDIPNKPLFIHLANELSKQGKTKNGLLPIRMEHKVYSNVFSTEGKHDISDLTVEEIFDSDGRLHSTLDAFEKRDGQIQYSRFIEEILLGDQGIGVAEAGTGLGKSLAYLFPALKRGSKLASSDGSDPDTEDIGPTIISCYTKHLQDQLFHKDLPQLAEALDVPIKAVKLKGRSNYICRTRLDWVLSDASRQLSPQEVQSLIPILIWLEWTQTGDMQECNGFWGSRPGRLSAMIQSEPGFCTTNLCAKHSGCFFGKIRKAVYDASVIIVNHALLLSEIHTPGILPPTQAVIIDEAHNLVQTAYSQLSLRLDEYYMMSLIQTIDPAHGSNTRWSKTLKAIGGLHPDILEIVQQLEQDTKETLTAIREFFREWTAHSEDRYSPDDPYVKKIILNELSGEFGNVYPELTRMVEHLTGLKNNIQSLGETLLEKDPSRQDYPELHQVFEQRIEILKELASTVVVLTTNQDPEWVYWQEGDFRTQNHAKPQLSLSINGVPVDVSTLLLERFFSRLDHCILTSATLRVGESFDYFLRRTGLNRLEVGQLRTNVFPSPFYYEDQVTYFQFGGPDSVKDNPGFIADVIYRMHTQTQKRILALFTSYRILTDVYKALRNKSGGRDLPLFAQVYGASRHSMMRGMEDHKNGIMLGTTAFWEGIDLPGEMLEILIITKLPFDVPTEPMVKAYGDLLRESGENSFIEYSVPECVIKFRQGFGRLIRTALDEGIFISLDDRVVTKRYGQFFEEAIPVHMQVFKSIDELLS